MVKNIHITTTKETIVPIFFIEKYKDIQTTIQNYKFKTIFQIDKNTIDILLDICIYSIIENSKYINENNNINIIFTHPPSTMFAKKEKDIDSVNFLLKNIEKQLYSYFRIDRQYINIYFKSIFSVNIKRLKTQKAQHFNDKTLRLKDLDNKYYINIYNKVFLKSIFRKNNTNNIIYIIDDISSTGATLCSCYKQLNNFIESGEIKNTNIELYSIAH